MINLLLFVGGLALLIGGAELLIRGAARVAVKLAVPPLIVGLTIVAFGTSAPEVTVSVKAALNGQAGIALGNVVGSNIFNVLFILGVAAVITPLTVSSQLIRFDVPLMIVLSALVWWLGSSGVIQVWEGLLLIIGLVVYVIVLVIKQKKQDTASTVSQEQQTPPQSSWFKDSVSILAGLALLVLGSHWLVDSATYFAKWLGVSDLVIGLTIVAAGTSMPEVVTSIVAAIRGERDIAIANVVGSNIFNILGVLGVSALVSGEGIPVASALVNFDIPVMLVVALACLPMFITGGEISRGEGVIFLIYYAFYTAYLILAAASHAALLAFSQAVLYFALPLTLITLFVIGFKGRQSHPR